MSIRSGESAACLRHASIERVGKTISSFRRVSRSSLTANVRRPSCPSAGPESCPSQMPRMFKLEKQILDQAVAVTRSVAPDTNVRCAMRSRMLVARNFSHPPSLAQGFDRHLLLDRGRVLLQIQFAQHRRPHGSKTILALTEPALESPVDAGGD